MSDHASRTARTLDGLIRGYQQLTAGRPPSCRFYPTCSRYAREAIATHGAWSGSRLALRRLGRCHPLGGHGYDPVPDVLRSRRSSHHRLRGADPC